MSAGRIAVVFFSTLATTVGLIAFFLTLVAVFGSGNLSHALIYGAVFILCLWYVMRVMRADRRQRIAEEAALPVELRPKKLEPRRPVTFQVRETAVTFAIWAAVVGVITSATGQPAPVVIGAAVFAGFMLATLTVTGRHMMFRITGDEEE